MTFSRILNAAAGALAGGSATLSSPSPANVLLDNEAQAAGTVEHHYPAYYPQYTQHHFTRYPQNPYTVAELYDEDTALYHSPYGLHNQGFRLKYGMADPGTGYGAPQQPHSYYGAPASTGYGQQSYQPQAAYHPPPPVHQYAAPSQQSHPRKSHHVQAKSTASAMSALTLLAFMFFLNILQSCLKEHMMTMNPTVMVMTAGAGRRLAALKSNVDVSLPEADSSEEPEAAAQKIDYSVYTPDVDAKMFGTEFSAESQQQHFKSSSRAAKSNRTIQAKLTRDVRFGHVLRRT